jgi:hypothetical protein
MARTVKRRHTIQLVPGSNVPQSSAAHHPAATARWVRFAERMVMKFNEYDDRFRRPVPSWHQILAANQTRNRIQSKWRYLLAATLIAFVTLTMELASHRTAPSHAGAAPPACPGFHLLPTELRRILSAFEVSGSRRYWRPTPDAGQKIGRPKPP